MTAGYTPGPWKIVGGATVLADDGEPVANILMPRPLDSEREANARLIAAAPEAFELLEKVYEAYHSNEIGREIEGELRNLIAKVRGETDDR